MITFSPRRWRIFAVSVLNLGCPGKIASSGKKRERDEPSFGVGLASGDVNPGQPSLEKEKKKHSF